MLKERFQNQELLSEYTREDFAEIYLFFDYDGHANNATDEKIQALLELFNEETENGKLFISYPMVEAIKHISSTIDFKQLTVEAKRNIKYKNKVHEEGALIWRNLKKLTYGQWGELLQLHLKKMHFIVTNNFTMPNEHISQREIFTNQLSKYLKADNAKVAVLSGFPIFLFDYYGYHKTMELIENSKN